MNEEDYQKIMGWIDRNSKINGYITEIGLRKLIKGLRRNTVHKFRFKVKEE